MNKIPKVYETKDYSMFGTIKGNRDIMPAHVAHLTSSIMQQNMLAQNPIVVNEKMEVIDGQHRLEVAKNNGLVIYYMIVPKATLEEIKKLNAFNAPWKVMNFIYSHAITGNKDYIWFMDMIKDYGLTISQLLSFVGKDSSHNYMTLRSGNFSATQAAKDRAEKRAKLLTRLRVYMTRKGAIPVGFIRELVKQDREEKLDKLVETIEEKELFFYPEAQIDLIRTQVARLLDGRL